MKRFTVGLMAGTMMTAVGVGYLLQDKKTTNTIRHKSKKMASKAGDAVEDVVDSFLEM